MKKDTKYIVILLGVLFILMLLGLIYFKINFISRREVKDIIINNIGDNNIYFRNIDLEIFDGDYEVEVYYKNREYQYIIDSKSGSIIFSNYSVNNVVNNVDAINIIEAKKIIFDSLDIDSGFANITKENADYDDGRLVYEIEFTYNNFKYEYKVDSISREIIEFDKESIFD